MRKFLRYAGIAGGTVALAVVGIAGPASATPPTGYGFDNTPHVIVGGGSDTTWAAQLRITQLWDSSPACTSNNTPGAGLSDCLANANPETNTLGNYQRDTVSQAYPVGSGAGIDSLNNNTAGDNYVGTVNGTPANVDFARSSRAPKTTGGACPGGNELTCDTFWGYAQDGVQISVFNGRSSIQSISGAISLADIKNIYNCTDTQWSQVASLGIAPGSAQDGPIVVWGMNSSSGTYGTMKTWLQNVVGLGSTYDIDSQACVHHLTGSGGTYPFENDIKPVVNDVLANGVAGSAAGLSGLNTDPSNPQNWIWFGSFGIASAYGYASNYPAANQPTTGGPTLTTTEFSAPINGVLPSGSNILGNTWTIGRTLFHVTKKADADCPKTGGICDFVGNPGPGIGTGATACAAGTTGALCDLNVVGGATGISGAVREYTRFQCRVNGTEQTLDPLTGKNYDTEITSAIKADGFQLVPVALRTTGSRCNVIS